MIIANAVASVSTLLVALLFFADALELWHLYIALFINGVANAFILPSLDSSIPLMVSKDQLGRAAGLTQLVQALETILAPALAGLLVGIVGLGAIFVVDFVTFGASIIALLLSAVPQPKISETGKSLWAEFAFGVNYIRERPAFLYLIGLVVSGFGVGSFIGGIALAVWVGPQRRMNGMLAAMVVAGIGTMLVGLRGRELLMAFGFVIVGVSFIFMVGLNRVIWQVKAAPDVLGRIFSLRVALGVGAQSLGVLIAGPLAETVFELLLVEGGALSDSVGTVIGVGDGRGMAFMFVLVGIALVGIAIASALVPSVRLLEDQIPDHIEPQEDAQNSSGDPLPNPIGD